MPLYEVVGPNEGDGRRTIYPDLTAAMVAASPTMEVWELADDAEKTRTVRCWPDPEFEPTTTADASSVRPATAEAARRWKMEALDVPGTEQFVRENIGRAEREASAILAERSPVTGEQVHALLSLAWGRGFVAGFGAGHEAFSRMLDLIVGGEAK